MALLRVNFAKGSLKVHLQEPHIVPSAENWSRREQSSEFFGGLAQFEPVKKQVRGLKPDAEPRCYLGLFRALFGTHARVCRQARGAQFPLLKQGAHPTHAGAVRGVTVFSIKRVEFSERSLGAREVVELEDIPKAARVRLLDRRVREAVVILNILPAARSTPAM